MVLYVEGSTRASGSYREAHPGRGELLLLSRVKLVELDRILSPSSPRAAIESRSMQVERLATAILTLLMVGCISCGESDARSEDGLATAARRQADATFLGNVDVAYGGLTAECKGRVSKGAYRELLEWAEAAFTVFVGVPMNQVRFVGVNIRNFSESAAEVQLIYDAGTQRLGTGDDDWQEWIYEDGRWRTLECPV